MSQALHVEWTTSDQANASFKAAVVPYVRTMLEAGQRLGVTIAPIEDDRSLKQNAFYWGACLKDISDQARIEGQRYAAEAWHELFKRQFLGYEIKKVSVAGSSRKRVIRKLRSTTGLSVRAMSKFLEQVQAFAANDLAVSFTVDNWQSYEGHRR